ncbi:MAG: hypothetical protein ACI97N_001375 [Cognaticolwellia sp.]|jgi:hypothetical protein
MYTTKYLLTIQTVFIICFFTISNVTDISAQRKKSAAQILAEQEINTKRSEVNTLKYNISLKKADINAKQAVFDARQAAYKAEEERIEIKDNAVKNRESCMSNLLADVLPHFGNEIMTEYSTSRNGGARSKKIQDFTFGKKMMEVLTPAYKLAHKEQLSTYVDNTDREAFTIKAGDTFEKYYLGGVDRSGDTLEGMLSQHFHPRNLPAAQDAAQSLADQYIQQLEGLHYADEKTMNMARAMPTEFYIGWNRFVNDCSLVLVHTMKNKRKKQRIPEVESQAQLGIELRAEYLHLEELKAQRQSMEEELYITGSNLKFLEESYLKRYKKSY